jgi:tetratricopeptide (TPR) repeat protein
MKLSRLGFGFLLLALLISASGCGWINSIRAKSQLNDAVSNYKDKNYDGAEEHARKAVKLDPSSENARVILAIVLQTEYRRGDPSDTNRKRAEEAIQLYKQIAEKNPNNEQGDTAFAAVTKLLGYLSQVAGDQADKAENPDEAAKFRAEQQRLDNEQLDWIRQRAQNESISKQKRAEAYAVLANKDWECSQAITEKPGTKQTVQKPDGSMMIQYKKPSDPNDFDKASKCTTEGLDLAQKAIDLDPESETAYAQKYSLLLEEAKFAKMQGDEKQAANYENQATEAGNVGKQLHDKAKAQSSPTPPAT